MTTQQGSGRLPDAVADTIATAMGQAERHDPVRPRTGGPAGNALLTAWVGLVLLVLFVAELATLLDVHGLITWHVAIGAVLIPPALVKTASTGWRILRYYTGNGSYRRAGPPPLVLRALGPLVVLTTIALLASGVVLVALGQGVSREPLVSVLGFRVDWITVHQAAFLAWGAATGLHVLGRLVPALRVVVRSTGQARRLPGSVLRAGVMLLGAAAAVLAAVLLVHADASWHQDLWWHPGPAEGSAALRQLPAPPGAVLSVPPS